MLILRRHFFHIHVTCASCLVQLFKVVFCGVRTKHTRGIYPGYYPTKNFCNFCRTFIPYLELLEVLYGIHTRARNFWKFCTAVATIPGVRVQHVMYMLGTSVSSVRLFSVSYVRLCHNTRNFWKFCKTFVPVPGPSGSSVRSPYPYPESL